MMLRMFLVFALSASIVYAETPQDRVGNDKVVTAESMRDFIGRYVADSESLQNFYQGLNPSTQQSERRDAHLAGWQKALEAVNFGALDQAGRIEFLLLQNKLNYERQVITRKRKQFEGIEPLLPFRDVIQELERQRYLKQPLKLEETAAQIALIPEQIKKIRERVEQGRKDKEKDKDKEKEKAKEENKDVAPLKVEPIQAKRAADVIESLRNAFKNWHGFYDGYLPEFSWWVKKPRDDADKAMEEFQKYLREEVAGLKGKDEDPLVGEAIGAQALAEDLAHEMIPYSAEELIAIGEREFEWCEARLKEAAKEMGLGEDWKAAMAKVKALHEPPGQQDQLIAQQARDAIEFVRSKDLVSVPAFCEETWRLSMISHEQQKTMPYAAYSGMTILAAYARAEMSNADKQMSMRGNNRHFTRIVTAHELIPGHHLQSYFAQRYRPYRELFGTSFYVEGWALYWEMKMWDMNFARGPEDRVGMLFWRMHRCARIIVTLKYHLGQMQPPEMIKFLMERVGHEKFGATSEVRRFIIYSPLYQCGYMLGALQLRALHVEMVGAGKMKEKEFNDALLKEGAIPIEMLRAAIGNLPLTKEFKPGWKFGK